MKSIKEKKNTRFFLVFSLVVLYLTFEYLLAILLFSHPIYNNTIKVKELEIEPIKLKHFTLTSYAFRIGKFAYVTDLSELSEEAFNKLIGIEYLIIEALRHESHYSHLSLPEAIDIAQRLKVKKAWFTHIGHSMGKSSDINPTLPKNMMLAYDGLEFIVE